VLDAVSPRTREIYFAQSAPAIAIREIADQWHFSHHDQTAYWRAALLAIMGSGETEERNGFPNRATE